jgi:adenosylhomocysteine nucleosidase
VDADGMTAVCATRTEARAAKRAGFRTAVIGIGARKTLPDGPVLSFGLAGALHDGLAVGDVLDATRIVDVDGATLWQGDPLGIHGARPATILAAERLLDDPSARLTLHRQTGADAADMESGALARTGRLTGCLRAVSDTPSQTLGPLAETVDDDGKLSWAGLGRAVGRPRQTWSSLARVRLALRRLGEVTA